MRDEGMAGRNGIVVMPVGDRRRHVLGHAIFATLLAAAVFSVLTGPVKQLKPLYNHAPWLNDPFDTIVSFAMFFVPFIALCCLIRVSLCRKSEPLPVLTVVDLVKGCRVLLVAIGATLFSEWIALAVGENRAQWNSGTVLQVVFVIVSSIALGRAAVALHQLSRMTFEGEMQHAAPMDWLGDMVTVAQKQSRWLGPLSRWAFNVFGWVNRTPVHAVRRHPVRAAALACGSFGLVVMVSQGIREGYGPSSTLLAVVLLGCGMFGLLVASGSYLGLVRSETPLAGRNRRLIDASVVTSVGILVPFAFRYHLWWIVGTNNAAAGIPQLASMLSLFALAIFSVTVAIESVFGLHAETA